MPLRSGQTLSFYEILGPLGAGGMGEVYRARDTRLEREVAIKVLPDPLAEDEERLRRFEREAKTLASLNHPGIAGIHGIDQVGDTCFLAMELVPGEDLAERLERGPLEVEEAVEVGRQIADALAVAHDSGIVHRDLKPANVRVTPDGVVKLLDFGLAKAAPRTKEGRVTPSIARPDSFLLTEEGLVLGTPTYMAPEQARGRAVDRRADVWALGCVLYECLTGRRAFAGETLADILAAIVEREPDLSRLPADTPPRLRALLIRMLAKDPRRRLQHVGDARLELEEIARDPGDEPQATAAAGRGGRGRPLALAVGLVVGAATTWFAAGRAPDAAPPAPRVVRASLFQEAIDTRLFPRIAPNGGTLALAVYESAPGGGTQTVLHLRSLDSTGTVRVPGSENIDTYSFSPDGSSLAFVVPEVRGGARRRMLRLDLADGGLRTTPLGEYAPDPDLRSGLVWTDDGRFVVAGNRARLLTQPVEGGAWREVRITGLEEFEDLTPQVYRAVPGGRHVLGTVFRYMDTGFEPWLLAIDVETGEARELVRGGNGLVMEPGVLLFSRGASLYAVRLDLDSLETQGTPQLLLEGLRTPEAWRAGWFDRADDGTLVHLPGGRQGTDRQFYVGGAGGPAVPWSSDRRAFDGMLQVARDGSFFTVGVAADSGLIELWGSEVDAPLLRPLLAAPGTDFLPGPIDPVAGVHYFTRLASSEDRSIWRAPLDAPERAEEVWRSEGRRMTVVEIAPDGKSIFARSEVDTGTEFVELLLPDPEAGRTEVELRTHFSVPADSWGIELSPDGRWVSHADFVDGKWAIVLRPRAADGSIGPVYPVVPPRGGDSSLPQRFQWAEWTQDPDAEHPTLLVLANLGEVLYALEVTGDSRPQFSVPVAAAFVEEEELLDFGGLPDGRVLMLRRGTEEVHVDRVELVLGFDSLLAPSAAR